MKPYLVVYKQDRLEADVSEIKELVKSIDRNISGILTEVRGGTMRQLIFTPSGIAIGIGVAYATSGTNAAAVPILLIFGLLGLLAGYLFPTWFITRRLRLRGTRNRYWIEAERAAANND